MTKFPLALGALFVAAPLALLLPGCSGGSFPGSPFPTATPKPNATSTATPAPTVSQTSNFLLGNGQLVTLKTTRTGTAITGTIQISAPVQTRTSAALSNTIKIGTFSITGTFTPERSYNITVKDGQTTLFTQSGLFPTATQTGTYSLTTFDGQTDSGIIPKIGGNSPTATPVPTATTPTGAVVSNLSFTPSSGSNFVSAPLTAGNFSLISAASIVGAAVKSDVAFGKDGIFLTFSGLSPTVGSKITLAANGLSSGYIYNYLPSGQIKTFLPQSGTITLTALSKTSATVRLDNVVFAANGGGNSVGQVTINGTLTAPLLTV